MSTFTTDKSSYEPDETIPCTINGAGEPPNGATINGVAASVQAGATSGSCQVTTPSKSDFAFGQPHEGTQFAVDQAMVLKFPTEPDSDPVNIQIEPKQPTDYVYIITGAPAGSIHPAFAKFAELGVDQIYVEDQNQTLASLTSTGIPTFTS